MSATMEEPQQINTRKRSPTTLDPTAAPQDELLMSFNCAASASDSSKNFTAYTTGSDLVASPLPPGIVVAGEIIDDPSTVSAPFLPGDLILACLLPPNPLLLSSDQDPNLRLRIPTRNALELPDSMSAHQATTHLAALTTGAAILKQELHIPVLRTPTASPTPAEDGGVGTYNHKRILIIGGETSLGASLLQLLHRALPEAKLLITTTHANPKLLHQRNAHLIGLGAKSAFDNSAPNLSSALLPPSVDIIINTVREEPVREDVMSLLEGLAKFVDCGDVNVEVAVEKFLEDEEDCVTSLHELLVSGAGVFQQTMMGEEGVGRLKREDSGVEMG